MFFNLRRSFNNTRTYVVKDKFVYYKTKFNIKTLNVSSHLTYHYRNVQQYYKQILVFNVPLIK
jgi:hypothetical protein